MDDFGAIPQDVAVMAGLLHQLFYHPFTQDRLLLLILCLHAVPNQEADPSRIGAVRFSFSEWVE